MHDSEGSGKPRLVLIASTEDWSGRALETILRPNGFEVVRAYSGAGAIEAIRIAEPDLIIIDNTLADGAGLELCRRLRSEPHISGSTPVLLIGSGAPTRMRRIEALRAGAWDQLHLPLDAEEVLLRIQAFSLAKRAADQARYDGLIDAETGLYNMRGIALRAQELGSQAARKHAPLSCIVLAPDLDQSNTTSVHQVAKVFKTVGRRSDAIGRVGSAEFGVVAIFTSGAGCVKTAERLVSHVPSVGFKAGYYCIEDFHAAPVDATETILRATTALQMARSHPEEGWVRGYRAEA